MRSGEELQRLVAAGDGRGVIAFLAGATEKERRSLAPAALECLRRYDPIAAMLSRAGGRMGARVGSTLRLLEAHGPARADPRERDAARAAAFATANWGEVKRLHAWCAPRPGDAWEILIDRRPKWLA